MQRTLRTALGAALLTSLLVPAAEAVTTDDTHVANQWGLDQIRVEQAWTRTTGAGVTIAVVDSGVDRDHPDLRAGIVGGRTFLDDGCADGCGDGDWLSGPDDDQTLDAAHGTHVAGIAAARRNNGTGVAGVAPDADIMPVRALGSDGSGFTSDIANAIVWATDNGADVINLSIGALPGFETVDTVIDLTGIGEAIDHAIARGVVVVAAAGNETYPLCSTPATFDGVICVTATGFFEEPTWYSNSGIKPDLLSVAAPGGSNDVFCDTNIFSTIPPELGGSFCGEATTGYESFAGTSMASPHVAGVAALLVAQGCSASEVHALLRDTSRTPAVGSGVWTPEYGHGIVDAAAATSAAATCGGGEPQVNTAPVANDDSATTQAEQAVTIDVLANDVDAEGDALTVVDATDPANGTVVVNGDGTLTYTPDAGFAGAETFSYTISDGEFTDTAFVSVNVKSPKGNGGGNGGGKGKK